MNEIPCREWQAILALLEAIGPDGTVLISKHGRTFHVGIEKVGFDGRPYQRRMYDDSNVADAADTIRKDLREA